MGDDQVVDNQQNTDRDQKGFDHLAAENDKKLLQQSLVDIIQGSTNFESAYQGVAVEELKLALNVQIGMSLSAVKNGFLSVGDDLGNGREANIGQFHDPFKLDLDLVFIQLPEAGRERVEIANFDRIDTLLNV